MVANWDKCQVYKTFTDDTDTNLPYGVESVLIRGDNEVVNVVWFATQEEQWREYDQCKAEISRGEWL